MSGLFFNFSCIFFSENNYMDMCIGGFPGSSAVNYLLANAGDMGLISGSGRSSGEGNSNPLQYSCLGNFMDGGAW